MIFTTTLGDRPNVQLAAIVDIGLELVAVHRKDEAVEFLTVSGVSFATLVRVLSEPLRRRAPLPQNVLPLPRLKR
jgi:hypothetical protein